MAALELSIDRDWIRFRGSYFFASGDTDISDKEARGFDTILGIVIALVGWITHLLIMVRAVAKPENPGQIDRP